MINSLPVLQLQPCGSGTYRMDNQTYKLKKQKYNYQNKTYFVPSQLSILKSLKSLKAVTRQGFPMMGPRQNPTPICSQPYSRCSACVSRNSEVAQFQEFLGSCSLIRRSLLCILSCIFLVSYPWTQALYIGSGSESELDI